MPSACAHEVDVALRDGSTVQLRPVQAADRDALRRLIGSLSERSLHSRFFTVPRSANPEVDRLLGADGERTVALVAESGNTLVGVASYTRDPRQLHRAEVAFAVADEAQGRGLGTQLLSVLADIARSHAIQRFEAYMLADNLQMLQVVTDSGFTVRQDAEAGVVHVSLELSPSGAFESRSAARAQVAATASMKAFFEPAAVAVVGAARQRGKIGAEILHNLKQSFRGRLFAVNPSAPAIDGVPSFPSLTAIPGAVDLAVICVPAAAVPAAVDDAIAKGVKAVVIITAGFAETGSAGRDIEAELVKTVRRAGIRMVGPNCMGLLNADPAVRLNATFSPVFPPPGRVAMSTQSGALGLAILDYAEKLHIGFSTFVSVGNKADVSSNDLLQYWENDPHTDVILLYVESFGNPRKFSQIARRISRTKPIVAVKAGRSPVGARAASSHTGALASSDAVVDALFRQSGVIRTRTIEELFDVAAVLAQQPVPQGGRVAILTNAGGPAILAADACEAAGLTLPSLSGRSVAALKDFLPPAASTANPVDMIASASADQYERALGVLIDDDNIDSVIVVFVPPMVTSGEAVAAAVKRALTKPTQKPVLAVFMSSVPAASLLAPVPAFAFPEAAASALARVTEYGKWRRAPEGSTPDFRDFDETSARAVINSVLERGGGWVTPAEASRLFAAARIAVTPSEEVESAEAAVAAARRVGYPVAVKAVGPTIVHKTERGAVRLRLGDDAAVRHAYSNLTQSLGDAMTGAVVQPMIHGGVEMLVGCVEDPAFGPVIACGLGGTTTELLADTSFRLAPLTDVDAHTMVDSLRGKPLLRGYRGAPVADESALLDVLLRLSALAVRYPELQEMEINPLCVLTAGAVALDARIRIDRPRPRPASRRITY